jgi:hypothetical protein
VAYRQILQNGKHVSDSRGAKVKQGILEILAFIAVDRHAQGKLDK